MRKHWKQALITVSIVMIALATVTSSYAQSYVTIYESDVYIPAYGAAHITVNPAPYAIQITCNSTSYASYYFSVDGGGYGANHLCTNTSTEYLGYEGHTVLIEFFKDNPGSIVHIKIEGYNQVGETVNTTPVPPTVTPYGYVPPTATSIATSVPISPVPTSAPPTPACGLSMVNPCWVAQATPISGGGGSGDFNAQTAVTVGNFPTPIPSATILPAIQQAIDYANSNPSNSGVAGTKEGDIQMMPDEVAAQGDTYTAGIKAELWDFGCPFDINTRGIAVHLCIKYNYISAITLVGIDLPVGIICQVMIVLAVVYMIKRR